MVTPVGTANELIAHLPAPHVPQHSLGYFATIEARPRQSELFLDDYFPDAVALYLEYAWREIEQRHIQPLLATPTQRLQAKFGLVFPLAMSTPNIPRTERYSQMFRVRRCVRLWRTTERRTQLRVNFGLDGACIQRETAYFKP